MARNIDDANAPAIDLVPPARNWAQVQGDRRAFFRWLNRDPASTDQSPVYSALHASEIRGQVLRSRGGTQTAQLMFNQATFTYNFLDTTTQMTESRTTNNVVAAHVDWDNAMVAALNPAPNRGVSLLYDIWSVTYPNATDNYIMANGDRAYYNIAQSAFMPGIELISTNGRQYTLTWTTGSTVDVVAAFPVGDIVVSRDANTAGADGYVIGRVASTTGGANQTVVIDVFTTVNGGTEGDAVPARNAAIVSSLARATGNEDTVTAISRPLFRGTIDVRERLFANSQAGNEDTNTN